MRDGCRRLTVTQVGGFAGTIAMAPLIDLDRARLDEAGRAAMDTACRQLAAAAKSAVAEPVIGADLAGFRIEMVGPDDVVQSFALAGPEATSGQIDVPQLLAPLLALSGAPR